MSFVRLITTFGRVRLALAPQRQSEQRSDIEMAATGLEPVTPVV